MRSEYLSEHIQTTSDFGNERTLSNLKKSKTYYMMNSTVSEGQNICFFIFKKKKNKANIKHIKLINSYIVS